MDRWEPRRTVVFDHMESVEHASCQEDILASRMPLQSPDTTSSFSCSQRLAHGSSVPDEDIFVVAI